MTDRSASPSYRAPLRPSPSPDAVDTAPQKTPAGPLPKVSSRADALPPSSFKPPSIRKTYTLFVRLLKIILPLVALGLMALLGLWPSLHETPRPTVPNTGGEIQMIKPRYVGVDNQSKPFSMTADRAVQSNADTGVIDLTEPRGEMFTEDGHVITVSAATGQYHQKSKILTLTGNVVLYHDDGYELKTSTATLENQTMEAWSTADVTGQGPFGTIEAKGFRLTNKGGSLILSGPGRVVLVNLD